MEERTFIDGKLKDFRDQIGYSPTIDPRQRSLIRFALYLGEAFMRAHRELDDDVWHIKEQLERHGTDLSAAMGHTDDSGDFYESGVPAGVGDGGAFLSERDLVDQALQQAGNVLDQELTGSTHYLWCQTAFMLTLINVRQIRDLDDSLSHLMETVAAHGAKIVTAIPDFKESLEPPEPPEKKRGLFS